MDKMRWRYGDTNPVVAAVDSSTVIEIGDLLYQDTDDAKPASSMADPELFAASFLGVAMQRSHSGDTDPIRLATTGVFEFECPSGTFELGDLIGAGITVLTQVLGENPGSHREQLRNQVVVPVAESKYAIGRVAKRVSSAAGNVLVDVRSTVMTGGVFTRKT